MMSRIIKIMRNNQYILIAFVELIAGAILLIRELRDFVRLPKTTEMYEVFGGIAEVIDLFKYQENTYCLLYLWTILLFAGITYWINRKLHWIFNQIVLMTMLFVAASELIIMLYFSILPILSVIAFLAVLIVVLLVFLWIWNRMYRKSYMKTIGIRSWKKWFSVCLGVISSTIYFFLKIW